MLRAHEETDDWNAIDPNRDAQSTCIVGLRPHVDRSGKPMTEGGGTAVVEATTPEWPGPGRPDAVRDLI